MLHLSLTGCVILRSTSSARSTQPLRDKYALEVLHNITQVAVKRTVQGILIKDSQQNCKMMQCKISSIQLTLRPPEEALLPLPDEERALLVEPARRLRRQRRNLSLVEPHPPAAAAAAQVAQFRAGRGGGEPGGVGPRRAPGAARFQTLQKTKSME